MDPLVINAVAFQSNGLWVAQCLEYNFVSCASTKEDLPGALMRQVLAQIESDIEDGNEPFFEFQPAPAKYWELLEKAKKQSNPIKKHFDSPQHQSVETQLFPLAA
jgi:hypothetical protein